MTENNRADATSAAQAAQLTRGTRQAAQEPASHADSTSARQAALITGRNAPAAAPDGEQRPATGDHARIAELWSRHGRWTDAERDEWNDLAEKDREDRLEGKPARVVRKRESVVGQGDFDEPRKRVELTTSELQARLALGGA